MGWLRDFYQSSIGQKWVVAVTGAIMVLFLIGHMLGNLQAFEGRGEPGHAPRLNSYAHLLRLEMPLLWTIRLGLLAALVLHVLTTVRLTLANRRARPEAYAKHRKLETTLATRTMIWGGLALGAYVVYHILHFTTGTVHRDLYEHLNVYDNVVRSFSVPAISAVYILAQFCLYMHLQHGILSMFQTLGVSHPRYVTGARILGHVLALIITLGFVAVPVGVLAEWIR